MEPDARSWRRLAWALFLLQAALIAWTHRDYGVTYDEEWRLTYGEYVVQWYERGFERVPGPENDAFDYWTLPNEAGLFGAWVALACRVAGTDPYRTAHVLGALLGLLAGVGAWRLGRRLASERAGFFAALMLLLVPRWYGHAFHNPIDVPMACFTVWALVFLERWARALPRPAWRDTVGLGIALGFALGTRIGAVLLFAYVGFALALWLALGGRPHGAVGRLAAACAAVPALAWAAMVPWWPKALVHPTHPYWALRAGLSFHQEIEVFFGGETLTNQEVPRSHLTTWLLISLPEFLLLALALGAFVWLARVRRVSLGIGIVVGAVAIPLAFTWLTAPTDYDGMRHFLFLVPPLCVLAAVGFETFLLRIESCAVLRLAQLVLALGALWTASDMVRLHPYQTVYFNRVIAGGLPAAAERYETDYWGASFQEGVAWLNANAEPAPGESRPRVASSGWPRLVTQELDATRFEYVGSVDHPRGGVPEPDLYLATRRWNRHEAYEGEVLHTVERLGVPLLYVKRVRPAERRD